jgi:proline racemase
MIYGNEWLLPMFGHGTIGSITIAIEEELIQPKHLE